MLRDNITWFNILFFSTFVIGFTSILTLCFFYLKKRFIEFLGLSDQVKKRIKILLFMMTYSPILMMALRYVESSFTDFLFWCAFISLGLVYFLVILTFLRDLGLLVFDLFTKLKLKLMLRQQKSNVALAKQGLNRREFFMQASSQAIALAVPGIAAYGMYEARKVANITPVRIALKNLPKEFDGFKISQITDIHVGPTIKKNYIEAMVEAVNSTKPDLVAITGDLVDGSVENLYPHVEPLKNLRSTHGSYFVTGNHEYYSGAESWIDAIRSLGIKVLVNEHIVLSRGKSNLILAGVTDYKAHRILPEQKTDPAGAIATCQVDGCKILLAHQPKSIYGAAEAGYDLQISGHTHGGQLFPINFIVHLIQPFVKGLHRYQDTWIYVNQGTGYWGIPMRVGAPSEIAEITLHSSS